MRWSGSTAGAERNILLQPTDILLCASPGGALRGEAELPGDKSISHRALILGALARGQTRIDGLLESADVLRTLAAVRALGATVHRAGDGWLVEGGAWHSPAAPIDCGNSGTSVRLLMGAAAGHSLSVTFTGDESLSRRPMQRVIDPLRSMGAVIGGGPTLPVSVEGAALQGIRFVNEAASAQVKSAILLAGLRAEGEVEIIEPRPSRDHSERMLRAFGVDVDLRSSPEGGRIRLGPRRRLDGTDVRVPGDPSSAAFPVVAALVMPGSEVRLRGVLANPLRWGLFDTLQEMGAQIMVEERRGVGGEEVVNVTARTSALRGVEVPATRAPAMIDEYPILAVAAAFAKGTTIMRGLSELRVKESDRLSAILAGLRACGVEAAIEGDTLIVEGCGGRASGGARVETHGDHRIAMAFLVFGLAAQAPVTVDRADMIETSFPGFPAVMRSLGVAIEAA
jgi:3-phosphoshikimate 1-carboxyvinyltransferase